MNSSEAGADLEFLGRDVNPAAIQPVPQGMEADRMNTADTLMVVYYVVLSGLLVFALGYLAGWHHAKRRQ
jgi:hypothetical protein